MAVLIHVVAGVIYNSAGEILLAQRPIQVHQGGRWEFPGGKREPGETPEYALQRELDEELGIQVEHARPLIQVLHNYSDKRLLLDVWQVETWHGTPWGREGQLVQWCPLPELGMRRFPAANYPVLQAVRLPGIYAITPEPVSCANFFGELEQTLRSGVKLLQFRAKQLDSQAYADHAREVLTLARRYQARVLLNAEPELAVELEADGVHLDSRRLTTSAQRPLDENYLVAASSHSATELGLACALGADFALLSPVRATASHPGAEPLGWQRFAGIVQHARCPVYALGGVSPDHLPLAWAHGAQGIAAIRGVWQTS